MQQETTERAWRRRIEAAAVLWTTFPAHRAVFYRCLPGTRIPLPPVVGLGIEDPYTRNKRRARLKDYEMEITSRIVDDWASESHRGSWEEIVMSATSWSDLAQRCIDSVGQVRAISHVPDVLRLQRSDFPTTSEWLRAEYRMQIKHDALADAARLRDTLLRSHPEDYRCWLTVLAPSKALDPRLEVHELLPRFRHVSVDGETFTQLPLTVVAMMCRVTDTTLSEWHPATSDPTGKSILDATLALLSADNRPEHILSMWGLACSVTEADEGVVYGSNDLTAAPLVPALL